MANQIFNAAYKLSPVPKDTHPFGTFSFAIAQIALSFIIEHEVAHILNGHLLLQQKPTEQLEMTMTHDDNYSKSMSHLDIQTLEMDADACAVTRTLSWATQIHRYAENGGKISDGLLPFFDGFSETEVITNTNRAITLAIVSLCQEDPELDQCKQQSHLPRTARIFHAVGLTEHVCKQLFNFSVSERVSIEQQSKIINDVILKVGGESSNRQDVLDFYLQPKVGYIHTLTRNWDDNISPKLQGIAPVSTLRKYD